MEINEQNSFIEGYEGNLFDSLYKENIIHDNHIKLKVSYWGEFFLPIMNKLILMILKLCMLNLVHQDHLDKYLGLNLFFVAHIEV